MALSKEMETIRLSANPDKNTGMEGHVTQHIDGMTPPPGTSQRGKTLFKSRKEFENIWNQYLYYANGVNCSGTQAQEVVSCEKLKVGMIEARSCTEADDQGRCTKSTMYVAKGFFFGFVLKKSTWILHTCYPQPMA
jgi:hypothetical protein